MKTLKISIVIVLAIILSNPSFAAIQHNSQERAQSETFKVWGNCNLCKARIEKAAKIEGVKKAEWNPQSKMMFVIFNPAVTSCDAIQKSIAAAGHDTQKFQAPDKAYESLPLCCQYPRKK